MRADTYGQQAPSLLSVSWLWRADCLAAVDTDPVPHGRRDHFLPAAYLGRFSDVLTGRARRRPLYVADRRASSTFTQSAENIARRPGLYDLPGSEGRLAGRSHRHVGVRGRLPAALDGLAARDARLDAGIWLQTSFLL